MIHPRNSQRQLCRPTHVPGGATSLPLAEAGTTICAQYEDTVLSSTPILTSSWFTPLPSTHLKIGISRGTPRGMAAGYRKFMKLAPGVWFNSVTPQEYQRLYQVEILDKLDPQRVVSELVNLANGTIPVLVCYEDPSKSDWCHRGLVSRWLKQTLDIDVFEFGLEGCGCGPLHPKLHPTQASGCP